MSKRKMFHDIVDNTVDAAIRINIKVRDVFSEENLLKAKKRLQESVIGAKLLDAVRFVSEVKYRKYTIVGVTVVRNFFERIIKALDKKDSK